MTRETEHLYQGLAGAAFVSLREVPVFVNDGLWGQVLGLSLVLPGGAEADVDGAELDRALKDIGECGNDWLGAAERRPDLFAPTHDGHSSPTTNLDILVPLILNDIDLPPARILIRLHDLTEAFQRIDVGAGVFARGAADEVSMLRCSHHAGEIGRHQCRSCMRRFWMIRAREKGLIDG